MLLFYLIIGADFTAYTPFTVVRILKRRRLIIWLGTRTLSLSGSVMVLPIINNSYVPPHWLSAATDSKDIYGELLDCIYLAQKFSKPLVSTFNT